MNSKHEEFHHPAPDIPVLLKIQDHFLHKHTIRSVSRFGKGTKIMLTNGDEIVVNVNYDKVLELVK